MGRRSAIRRRKRLPPCTGSTPNTAQTRARGGEYTFLIVTVVGAILLVVVLLFVWHSQATSSSAANSKSVPKIVPDPLVPQPPSPSRLQKFQSAAVCTDGPPCSKIGRDILMKGGNAVDAAIAALFCNGVVNSQSMGLGGGFMMTLVVNKTAYSVTAREMAPKQAHKDMFRNNSKLAQTGGLAVGVPGELIGYWEVWNKFGTLNWSDIVQPTIELCHSGYNMTHPQHDSIYFRHGVFDSDPIFRDLFFDPVTKDYKKAGSLIKPKKICETLTTIAKEGGLALNNGSLTAGFVKDIRDHGGIITVEDMKNYRVQWSKPVEFKISGGYTAYSSPAPASGLLLAFIMQTLEQFNITVPYSNNSEAESPEAVRSYVQTIHWTIEAYKFAFAQRIRLGDPNFVDMKQVTKDLLSKSFINNIRNKIHENHTIDDPKYYEGVSVSADDHGTAHIAVLDVNGDAVSVTSTINLYFGAGFISQSTGIIPNCVMDDFSNPGTENFFSLKPSVNNMIEPRKRPLSSACPTVVLDKEGDVTLVVGAAGGTKIITAVSWVMMRYFWFKENIKQAMDASRIHHQLFPNKLEYEYGLTQGVITELINMGYQVKRYKQRGSIVCAITKINGTIYANADFRKGGEVYGF